MAASRMRSVADPSIGVSDLLTAIETYLDGSKDQTLQDLVEAPPNLSWKTSPLPAWLARLGPLWKNYLQVAPNGVLPAKRHRSALEKLQERRHVNKDMPKTSPSQWADKIDERARIGLAQLRILKQDQLAYGRCMRKCDQEEQDCLQAVLSQLKVEEVEPSECRAMVVYGSQGSRDIVKLPEKAPSPWDVFSNVISRPSLEVEDDSQTTTETPSAQRTPAPRQRSSPVKILTPPATSPREGRSLFLDSLQACGLLNVEDVDLIDRSAKQKPINHGFSSQLTRARAVAGKSKAKPKSKAAAKKGAAKKKAKKPAEEDEEEIADEAQAASPNEPESDAENEETQNEDAEKQDEQKEDQNEDQEVEDKAEAVEDEKGQQSSVPEGYGFDSTASRALNRKRFTSRKWHQAFTELKKNNELDDEERKKRAREASQEASKLFEKLWPRGK